MKKIIYGFALLLSLAFYSADIYADDNKTEVKDQITTEVNTNSDYYDGYYGDLTKTDFIGIKKSDNMVYVKGNNSQGQFGLGHYNKVTNPTPLSFTKGKVKGFDYDGKTLKLYINDTKTNYYIAGEKADTYQNPGYRLNLNSVFTNGKRNIFVKVEGNKRTYYSNKELTKKTAYAIKSGQNYKTYTYYTNGKVNTYFNANYSKNIPTKIIRTNYYSNGKFAKSYELTAGA